MSDTSDSTRSTAPSSGLSHLSLDCLVGTLVPQKLAVTKQLWNSLEPCSRACLLQLSGSFREDILQDLLRLAVAFGYSNA